MSEQTSKNKVIIKNTLFLYMRMLVIMIVSLYTSRVVLRTLGVSDYGIYNLVGGLVSMLAFLNVGMSGASQRFISFELGKGHPETLKNVFGNCKLAHLVVATIIILIMEIIGIYLVNYKLIIPDDRVFAANWAFQCSILTCFISVISVPYNACIIAHEKMSQFAYISIYETGMKLIIVYFLMVSNVDKLILYATLLLFIQISVRLIYTVYCRRNFDECSIGYKYEKSLFSEMISFAGWGCVGNIGFSLKDQLSNIILNLFYGTTINAARGIATQVNSIISNFAANFTTAVSPQITKQYASGNNTRCMTLTMSGARYAFFLMMIMVVPIIININYVLWLWLGNVPKYTSEFVCIILVASLVYSMSHTVSTAIQATGYVKIFQIGLAVILLLDVPIGYILLNIGFSPYWAVVPCVFTNLVTLFFRIYLLKKYIPECNMKDYCINTVAKNMILLSVALVISFSVHHYLFEENFIGFICESIISIALSCAIIYLFGLTKREREMLYNKIKQIVR